MSGLPSVCGAVVVFNPEDDVFENLAAMVAECGLVFVADNGSSADFQRRLAAMSGIERIDMGANRGIGAALNAAASHAQRRGFDWMVTFDQDSRPRAGFTRALVASAERNPRARMVVPRIVEAAPQGSGYRWVRPHRRWPGLFERVVCGPEDLENVTMAVTSGSLTHLETWRQLGGFDEALFIDYVDVDYCLRVVRSGAPIVVSATAFLEHHLGARTSRVVLGHDFRPTFHAVFRHYFMARNRIHLWRRYAGVVPHWAVFDLGYAIYNCVRVLAFEPEKILRLRAMILGAWDGLDGKMGPCPPERREKFVRRRGDSGTGQ